MTYNAKLLVRGWWRNKLASSRASDWRKLVSTDDLYNDFISWFGGFHKRPPISRQEFSTWMFIHTGAKRAQKTVNGKRVRAARFDTISKHKEMFIHG